MKHLKEKLEEYMSYYPKVRIVRTKKREGLIRTRLLGASMAKGEVLTFLDSHCEVNVNWLPPLLNQIALNHRTIVCPMIDVIDHNHFGYEAQAGDAMRGAFDWEMYYKRIPIPPELQRTDPSEPFESPVMAGGLFAVNRKWFWELGGYDPGLEIWGGEQYEISFKVWMCGGEMFDVPCSRVGHIYRKYVPYKVPTGTSLARNLKRVAETWMDEYAEYIYQRRPEYRHLSTGDLTSQKELRKHLKCKDFKWFMAEVAWDIPKYYPPVEPPPAAWGEEFVSPFFIFPFLLSQLLALAQKNNIKNSSDIFPRTIYSVEMSCVQEKSSRWLSKMEKNMKREQLQSEKTSSVSH
ncbi:polypeptide N-acetylgalactosaminyltransferase-like 6 [Dendropsophus ebraccatus]|uniref:polypeptide N-acetylgalactosaminyltransferase-like 6 n=1 Tax=Dendropsophus ebraccatus TaxID=150705 RepID=UPI003831C579